MTHWYSVLGLHKVGEDFGVHGVVAPWLLDVVVCAIEDVFSHLTPNPTEMHACVPDARVRQKTQALKRRKIHSPVRNPQHDKALCIVGIQLGLVRVLRVAQRQGENAARKLIMHGGKIPDLVALKTPYWLSMAVLKVECNAAGNIGRAGSQGRVF
ncbi:hypothetical protein HG530_006789 [Fusarium avenaceum]|nr:hypothetical protein HG530_006789 [Fusarium avenaceum]